MSWDSGSVAAVDHHTKLNQICKVHDYISVRYKILDPKTNGHKRNFAFTPSQEGLCCLYRRQQQRQTHTQKCTVLPPVWVGGVATQQLSGAAYGVSNWVEQHSWRTPVQDLASRNQSHNPLHIHRAACARWVGGSSWTCFTAETKIKLVHWECFTARFPFWMEVVFKVRLWSLKTWTFKTSVRSTSQKKKEKRVKKALVKFSNTLLAVLFWRVAFQILDVI